jgi:hypothetical protein
MIDHVHPKGEFSIAYSAMFMNMSGNQQGTNALTDGEVFKNYVMAPAKMNMQMHMLMPMYGITDRLTAMAMIGYNTNRMTMHKKEDETMSSMPGMNAQSMPSSNTSSGLADTKVYLMYNLLGNCMHRLVASAGTNIPTGSIMAKGGTLQSANDILPYNMQPGSGTFDLLPGLVYVGQTDRLSFGAATSACVRMSGNARGYRFGNEYSLSPWAAYKFLSWASFSLRGEMYHQDNMKGYDMAINQSSLNDPSADVRNYGRSRVSALGGLNFYFTTKHLKDARLLLEYGLPLWQNVNGIQMTSKGIVNIRVQYSFVKK